MIHTIILRNKKILSFLYSLTIQFLLMNSKVNMVSEPPWFIFPLSFLDSSSFDFFSILFLVLDSIPLVGLSNQSRKCPHQFQKLFFQPKIWLKPIAYIHKIILDYCWFLLSLMVAALAHGSVQWRLLFLPKVSYISLMVAWIDLHLLHQISRNGQNATIW